MPRKAKPGDKINGYEIIDQIGVGAMALSYAARSPSGEKVFFKQYKSPTVTKKWYRGYVDYQKEMKRRIESSAAKRFTYRFVDFFEAKFGSQCYFQVFEFVEEGHDLEEVVERIQKNPRSVSWEQRLTFAKVIMASIHALHEAGVVHCDLKPPNIQLFKDDTIKTGYVVKLIDMDFSILVDQLAPWHGDQGYVGSPRYFSPEHLSGSAPQRASDVFTCGLILCELLGEGHPYPYGDTEEYSSAVVSYTASPPRLVGSMPEPANDADVIEAIHRCLSNDPAVRPSAKDVNLVLNGRLKLSPPVPSTPIPGPTDTGPLPPPPPPPPPPSTAELELLGESGQSLRVHIRTELGKYACRAFGEDAKYFDNLQFVLDRRDDGQWLVEPNKGAKNETILNGKAIVEPTPLKDGDVLAVGRQSKGITKLPLTVKIT